MARIKLKTWTPETVRQLEEHWKAGTSISDIVKDMKISKNAIIGKAHRLKLPIRTRGKSGPKTHIRSRTAPGIRVRQRVGANVTFNPDGLISLVKLGPHDCKWPVGDPREDDFGFCGATRMDRSPYCKQHVEVAYR